MAVMLKEIAEGLLMVAAVEALWFAGWLDGHAGWLWMLVAVLFVGAIFKWILPRITMSAASPPETSHSHPASAPQQHSSRDLDASVGFGFGACAATAGLRIEARFGSGGGPPAGLGAFRFR